MSDTDCCRKIGCLNNEVIQMTRRAWDDMTRLRKGDHSIVPGRRLSYLSTRERLPRVRVEHAWHVSYHDVNFVDE